MDRRDDINITINLNGLEQRLDRIHHELHEIRHLISTTGEDVMAVSARIIQEVTETKTIQQSAIVLLNQLSQLIRDNVGDEAALNALADDLDSSGTELAAAVEANTPAAPPA